MRVTLPAAILLPTAVEPSCYSRLTNEWFCGQYLVDRRADLVEATAEHLWITVAAVAFGVLLAFPLALLARRYPRLEATVLGVSTGLYTIPSLALFPLLVPFTGLSKTTVVIGLGLYALTILVRSMLEGLRAVPEEVRESATGLGYGAGKLLLRIELPLALPVIMAGLRVATVSTVALTTVGLPRRLRRPRQPDQGRRQHQLPRRAARGRGAVRRARDPARRGAGAGPAAAHPVDERSHLVTVLGDAWNYLTSCRELDRQRRHARADAAAAAAQRHRARRSPSQSGSRSRCGSGTSAVGGFLAINISNVGRAVPTFALLALLVTFDFPGRGDFGPYGRAGLATLIALALFALPPIITNSYVAVREVSAT